jgi:hypothetical protein
MKHRDLVLPCCLLLLGGCSSNGAVRGVVVIPAERHSQTTVITQTTGPVVTSRHRLPRNPRHGQRYPYGGVVLIFNAELGVYAVDRHPGLYFYGDHYLRRHDSRWQTATSRHGPWHPARPRQVPNRLLGVFNGGPQVAPPAQREQGHEHDRRDDHRRSPAQAQRLRHQGNELRYDRDLGAYRVVNRQGLYFLNNHYIRYYRGDWQVSKRLSDSWRTARKGEVPRQLQQSRRGNDNRSDKAREKNRLQGTWK